MSCVISKVVNTVPVTTVPTSMYRTNMYTDIETSTFRTGLNTNRTGHVPTIPAGIEKSFFFFFFKFCNFQIFVRTKS